MLRRSLFIAAILTACGPNRGEIPVDVDGDDVVVPYDCDDRDALVGSSRDDADCDGVPTAEDCNDDDAAIGSRQFDADCDGISRDDDCDDLDPAAAHPSVDGDCDGVPTEDDCNDDDAGITNPANDADCDGVLTEDDCSDIDPNLGDRAHDADCDGHLTEDDCDDQDPAATSRANDADCDGAWRANDCDDEDPTSNNRYDDADCDGVLSDDDCVDTDPSIHTCIEPASVIVRARFGYDAATDTFVAYTNRGYVQEPVITVFLGNSQWNRNPGDVANHCTLEAISPTLPPADWVGAHTRAVTGFEPETSGLAQTIPWVGSCLQSAVILADPQLAGDLGRLSWGVAVLEALDSDYEDFLVANGWTPTQLALLTGGALEGDVGSALSPTGLYTSGLTKGWQVDGTFTMVTDASGTPVRMSQDEMVIDGALATGAYEVQLGFPYTVLASLLAP